MAPHVSLVPPCPAFWVRFSLPVGHALQATGLVLGAALLYAAAHLSTDATLRISLMLLGWFAMYVCCHALAHWAVGRLVGMRFRGYGVRGTDHPQDYPPGLRHLLRVLPFFTILTVTASVRSASPLSQALMLAAGETSSTLWSLLAAGYAWRSNTPGGSTLFVAVVVWTLGATVTTALVPRGDYTRALRALRNAPSIRR